MGSRFICNPPSYVDICVEFIFVSQQTSSAECQAQLAESQQIVADLRFHLQQLQESGDTGVELEENITHCKTTSPLSQNAEPQSSELLFPDSMFSCVSLLDDEPSPEVKTQLLPDRFGSPMETTDEEDHEDNQEMYAPLSYRDHRSIRACY